MLKRLIHFVQYHNFFTITMMALFMGASATFAASPETILQKTETVRSVDNSFVVHTDLDTFDAGLKILSVKEDADRYYVEYSYRAIEPVEYVWQPVVTPASMKVSKKELAGRDLGLYVAEQLGQMLDQHFSFLKEVQKREVEKGVVQKVVAVEYSGLVGQFLSDEENTFEGYQPVKPPLVVEVPEEVLPPTVASVEASVSAPSVPSISTPVMTQNLITREEAQRLIQEAVQQLLVDGKVTPATPTEVTSSSPIPASSPEPVPSADPAPTESSATTPPAETVTPASEPTPTEATPVETTPAPATEAPVSEPAPTEAPAVETAPTEPAP